MKKRVLITIECGDIHKSIRKPLSIKGVVVMACKKGKGSYKRNKKDNNEDY